MSDTKSTVWLVAQIACAVIPQQYGLEVARAAIIEALRPFASTDGTWESIRSLTESDVPRDLLEAVIRLSAMDTGAGALGALPAVLVYAARSTT